MSCVSEKNTFIPRPLAIRLIHDRLGYSRREIKAFCSGTYSIDTTFLGQTDQIHTLSGFLSI